jgi:hypothetical protein
MVVAVAVVVAMMIIGDGRSVAAVVMVGLMVGGRLWRVVVVEKLHGPFLPRFQLRKAKFISTGSNA